MITSQSATVEAVEGDNAKKIDSTAIARWNKSQKFPKLRVRSGGYILVDARKIGIRKTFSLQRDALVYAEELATKFPHAQRRVSKSNKIKTVEVLPEIEALTAQCSQYGKTISDAVKIALGTWAKDAKVTKTTAEYL